MRRGEIAARKEDRFERAQHDFYVEPPIAVDQLLAVETFRGQTWDPACGTGTIPKVFHRDGRRCIGTDIVNRGWDDPSFLGIHDFLGANLRPVIRPQNIVTNPPFGLAEKFVRKALGIADHKVAALVRLNFLEGQKRKAFFKHPDCHLSRVLVFSWRVCMPPGDSNVPKRGGMIAFCWLVFDKDWRGQPVVDWL